MVGHLWRVYREAFGPGSEGVDASVGMKDLDLLSSRNAAYLEVSLSTPHSTGLEDEDEDKIQPRLGTVNEKMQGF